MLKQDIGKQQKNRHFLNILIVLCSVALLWELSASAYQFPNNDNKLRNDDRVKGLQAISQGVAAIAENTRDALVFISVSKTLKGMPFNQIDPFEFFFGVPNPNGNRRPRQPPKQEGLGSGFFIDLDKGYIVTNNHVIEGADEINLKLANGKTYDGKVIGRDKNTDIAIVQIIDKKFERKDLTALSFGNSEGLKVGDFVVALGAPFGLEASISFGVVSALGRGNLGITKLGNFIQTDAAINPGNSGGPLLNTAGEVIGVNTAIFSKSGAYAGIGFAVPSKLAKLVGEQLVNKGKVTRGYIGAGLQSLNKELAVALKVPENTKGVLVTNVVPGAPASKGGMIDGDIILKIQGKEVKSPDEVVNTIGLNSPGKTVKIEVLRKGKKITVPVTIGKWPDEPTVADKSKPTEDSSLGLNVQAINKTLKNEYNLKSNNGVVVTGIKPDSTAAQFGIRTGDLIVAINQSPIKSTKDFERQVKGKKRLLFQIERQGQFFFVSVRL